ncbi:MAG: C2H2-type zinc finger protein [Thermoproteota archaeon]|nr:C2H2-type zinc finger protein [Thermoproteota archaeon]
MDNNNLSSKIKSERHIPSVDSKAINEAVERASTDRDFISRSVDQLNGLKFPAYKAQILDFVKKNFVSSEILDLFESLNGTTVYRDQYHIKKAIEQNNSEAKQENQITDETRTNLNVKKVNPAHKRKDYPEVPATAMREYVCDLCGKTFQTRDDLIHHQEFEFKGKSK